MLHNKLVRASEGDDMTAWWPALRLFLRSHCLGNCRLLIVIQERASDTEFDMPKPDVELKEEVDLKAAGEIDFT